MALATLRGKRHRFVAQYRKVGVSQQGKPKLLLLSVRPAANPSRRLCGHVWVPIGWDIRSRLPVSSAGDWLEFEADIRLYRRSDGTLDYGLCNIAKIERYPIDKMRA